MPTEELNYYNVAKKLAAAAVDDESLCDEIAQRYRGVALGVRAPGPCATINSAGPNAPPIAIQRNRSKLQADFCRSNHEIKGPGL